MIDIPVLTLPTTAVTGVVDEIASFGRRRQETGGFLMAPTGATTVSAVAVTGTTGITRYRNSFQISSRALARLFDYADDHDLRVPVQFHSHENLAFLSRTDTDHGLRADGFTSVVVPNFGNPPAAPASWGWWTFRNRHWQPTQPARTCAGTIQLIRFDEDGIHAY